MNFTQVKINGFINIKKIKERKINGFMREVSGLLTF